MPRVFVQTDRISEIKAGVSLVEWRQKVAGYLDKGAG
jgi:hypothetical protein